VRHNLIRTYKFLDERWGLEDIAERHVKVSTFADMNDPFELIGSQWDSSVDGAYNEDAIAKYGAMCLSRNYADPLLWAHYADKHRGICLGIDVPDDPTLVHSVIYAGEREVMDSQILWKAIYGASYEAFETTNMRKLLFKYKGWQYEDEVRMITPLKEGLTFFEFNDEDFILRQVILGLRSTLTKNSIVNRLCGFGHEVEILQATLSSDEFRIIPRPIDDCSSTPSAHSYVQRG
jgi:hypothetical protein